MNSPSLRQRIDFSYLGRIAQHLPESVDLTLITLKGHLLVEELLDSIIESHCKDKAILQGVDISFFVKLKIAAALTGRDELSFAWKMGEKLNALRNALAHKLEHPLAQKRLDGFLELFHNSELELESTGDKSKDLRRAIIFFVGCLMAIKDGAPLGKGLTIGA
jgi:hypothetical protein